MGTVSLSVSIPCAAADWEMPFKKWGWELPDSIQIHGFASQSYIHTTGNNFFGYGTNMGSLDFTEMGLNGSWRPIPQLQTSMQVVYRRAGRTDNQDVRLDFGFLDYSLISDVETSLGIRLGRVVNPYGLYNDTRDMPFTRPSIFLPQSIYADINRNFALSGDGIQVYGEHQSAIGDFLLQVNGFYSRTNDPSIKADLAEGLGFPGRLNGAPSWIGRLVYEWDHGRIRLAATSGDLDAQYQPRGTVDVKTGSLALSPILFSAQYNAEYWSLTSEYAIRGVSLSGFGPLIPNINYTGESYYVQGSYRFREDLEGYLRYDVIYDDVNDRNGKQAAAGTGSPAYRGFAKDITAGLRWDVTSWFMLRAEYHQVNGTSWLSPLENQGDTQQHWNMFAISASFRF